MKTNLFSVIGISNFFISTIILLIGIGNNLSAANAIMSESSFLEKLTYEGTLNKNGQFSIEVRFPLISGLSPKKVVDLMTEDEISIKASDTFVSTVTVNKVSPVNKIVTSKIKIFYVYPDKVQISCNDQGSNLEYKADCSMTDEAYMTNKFNYYKDSFYCNNEYCSIFSNADMAKGIFGVSENTLAAVIAEKAIVRNASLGYIANNLPYLNTSDLIKQSTKEFKKLSVFKNEVDNLDEGAEELIRKLNEGKCSIIKISYKNSKRQLSCN